MSVASTVLSAGFFIFVYWKVAVHRVHDLRPCTGILFPVYSRSYYGLQYIQYTVPYFFLPTNVPGISGGDFFFFGTVKLQRICRNSVILSYTAEGLLKLSFSLFSV